MIAHQQQVEITLCQTAYFYECADAAAGSGCNSSRLLKIAAVLTPVEHWSDINWSGADVQVTSFVYGAPVVDTADATISQNNGWIKEVHYPDPATGLPSVQASLTFAYYGDGKVASRTDAKGFTFQYQYDEQGRLAQTTVIDYQPWRANGVTLPYMPPATVAKIAYTYTPDGLLELVTAYDTGNNTISQNKFEYDDLRNLVHEWQSHGAPVDSGTPVVDYTWQYSPLSQYNFNRVGSMTYPVRPGSLETGRRTLTYNYGNNTDALDSALSRITEILDSGIGTSPPAASYSYMGTNRRIGLSLGNGIAQTVFDGTSYSGLDGFGRITDLHFKHGSNTLHQYQYGYDLAGNRTYARVTQAPIGSDTHVNDRSYHYGYDELSRLIASQLGRLNESKTDIENNPAVALARKQDWELDSLGNWLQLDQQDDTDGDGTFSSASLAHFVDGANQIDVLATSGGSDQQFINDPAGNLVFDGQFVYQYDAWNRLVQVNQAGTLAVTGTWNQGTWTQTASDFDAQGKIAPASGHEIGDVVMQCIYDGLGRLMQMRQVMPGSESLSCGPLFKTQDYYYDGVRRVQEVLREPAVQCSPLTSNTWTEREYIYGPDYVDEFVAQVDQPGDAEPQMMYMLQDANYNVMAIFDNPQSGQPNLLAQYTYDPYGNVAVADPAVPILTEANGNENVVGHQGLFAYRLSTGDILGPNTTRLYYNRNRWYSPGLGRFLQRDSNNTGEPLIASVTRDGTAPRGLLDPLDAIEHYSEGVNLYRYANSNPCMNGDPLGLYAFTNGGPSFATNPSGRYDPFEEVDKFVDDRIGNALYQIGEVNRVGALGLRTSLDVAEIITGVPFNDYVDILVDGGGKFWESVNEVLDNGYIPMVWEPGGDGYAMRAGFGTPWGRFSTALQWGFRAGQAIARWVGHHSVPNAVLKKLPKKTRDALEALLIKDGEKLIISVPEEINKLIHKPFGGGFGGRGGMYNERWWRKIGTRLKTISAEELAAIRKELVNEFRLQRYARK